MVNSYFRYNLILHNKISCPFCNGITKARNYILLLYNLSNFLSDDIYILLTTNDII